MFIPMFWRIDRIIALIASWMKMLSHYQSELSAYSDSTSSKQRIDHADMLLPQINQYCLACADAGHILPPTDIRLLFFLWIRLDAWHDLLSEYPANHYLIMQDPFSTSVVHYLLKPIEISNAIGEVLVVPYDALGI